jgi:sulfate adenylyltransferase large subunit
MPARTQARPQHGLLRFATIGSVDDGKSTLIGRLLHDAKGLFDDQIEAVARTTARRGGDGLDLSLVTDGLRAEREQGITIDVAYRYFATPRRTFIVGDNPGHAQYTRNMATGASTAELAVALVDARAGLLEQTRRHLAVACLFGIKEVVLAVNKMDLVGWSQTVFDSVVTQATEFLARLGVHDVTAIPISALGGGNVVDRQESVTWYEGPTLLEHLETVTPHVASIPALRLPIQLVLRTDENGGVQRRYAGLIGGGRVRVGDPVTVWPAGVRTTITDVEIGGDPVVSAEFDRSVSVQLADDVDATRGDLIAGNEIEPTIATELRATLCWFGTRPLATRSRLLIKHTTRVERASVRAIEGRLDLESLEYAPADELVTNDIGRVTLGLAGPLAIDPYEVNRSTGSFIVIDPDTQTTVAAGIILHPGG